MALLYSNQLARGEDYGKLKKVIGICILDYNFEKTKEIESMHTKWELKEALTGKDCKLTDSLELHMIELPKLRRALEKNFEDELVWWMLFLDNPNEIGGKIMDENKEIKKAMDELEEISQDEELRRVAELEEKAIKDEKNRLRHATKEGYDKGLQNGLKQGLAKGEKSKSIEIAKKLLELGHSIEEVLEITGLSQEELENI